MSRAVWLRVLSGAGVLAAAAGAVAAGSVLPAAGRTPVEPAQVPLPAGDAVLACPGPPLLPGAQDAPGTDTQFGAAPAATTTAAAAVALAGAGAPPALTLGAAEGAAAGPLLRVTGPGAQADVARAVPADAAPVQLAAVQVATTPSGDLRGIAASACVQPSESAWLVGGGTVVGRSGRLVVVNPGATPATVDLTVLTGDGAVRPPAGQGLTLAPGAQTAVLVEGLAPDAEAVAVHVAATGGRVAAALVDTALRGLVPAGVDTVVPGAAPAAQQVVPGLVATEGGPEPALRLAVPGGEDGVVRWRLLGPAGPVVPSGAVAATVPAGSVVDVPLEGLEPGTYTAVVDADVPVLAGGVSTSSAGEGAAADTAWSPATAPLSGTSLVALPPARAGVASRLVLSADAAPAEVVVRALAADGSTAGTTRVPVGLGSTASVDVGALAPDGAVALLVQPPDGVAGLHAAVALSAAAEAGAPLVSLLAVAPAPVPPTAVGVRPVQDGRWP